MNLDNITFSANDMHQAIERAFQLGKRYAVDELNAVGHNLPEPGTKRWDDAMRGFGGYYAGEAKGDILKDIIQNSRQFIDLIQFD